MPSGRNSEHLLKLNCQRSSSSKLSESSVKHHSVVKCKHLVQINFNMESYAKQTVNLYCKLTAVDRLQLKRLLRSTPEAEAMSMASTIFGETLNVQDTLQMRLQRPVPVTFEQNNKALIKILKSGYSFKLRRMGRVHRINIASMGVARSEQRSAQLLQHHKSDRKRSD